MYAERGEENDVGSGSPWGQVGFPDCPHSVAYGQYGHTDNILLIYMDLKHKCLLKQLYIFENFTCNFWPIKAAGQVRI